jgi:hypothetical protein
MHHRGSFDTNGVGLLIRHEICKGLLVHGWFTFALTKLHSGGVYIISCNF